MTFKEWWISDYGFSDIHADKRWDFEQAWNAALASLRPEAPPTGTGPSPTVLVPREATDEMLKAAHSTPSVNGIQRIADVYRAMVAAGEVPSLPQQESP